LIQKPFLRAKLAIAHNCEYPPLETAGVFHSSNSHSSINATIDTICSDIFKDTIPVEVLYMCERYTMTITEDELLARYMIDEPTNRYHTPRYNVVATQQVPVILNEEGIIKFDAFKWGLIRTGPRTSKLVTQTPLLRSHHFETHLNSVDA
jgi:hypothetical protein